MREFIHTSFNAVHPVASIAASFYAAPWLTAG